MMDAETGSSTRIDMTRSGAVEFVEFPEE